MQAGGSLCMLAWLGLFASAGKIENPRNSEPPYLYSFMVMNFIASFLSRQDMYYITYLFMYMDSKYFQTVALQWYGEKYTENSELFGH